MKKKIAVILALLMLVMSFTGCGSSSNDLGTSNVSEVNDTLRVALGSLNTLNPYKVTIKNDMRVRCQIFDNLVNYKDKVEKPRLADSYDISDDGLTYTFKIKQGVKFHNGAEMTVEDVVFSYETAMKEPFMSNYTGMIESVEATDDTTFVVHLSRAYLPFIDCISNIYIVNKEAYESGDPDNYPVGTGPYKFVSYEQGVKLTLEAFEDYFRGVASIKNVEVNIMSDESARLLAFESGDLDVTSVPSADWERISSNDKYNSRKVTTAELKFIGFNLFIDGDLPYEDVRVRQACAYAIDREDVNLIANNGYATVARSVGNPEVMFGANEEGETYEHDVEKAKALLAEAGYPNGINIGEIYCPSYSADAATAVVGCLAEAGITAQVIVQDSTAFYAAWEDYAIPILCDSLVFGNDFNDWGQAFTTGGIQNTWGYQTEELDAKWDVAAAEVDTNKRLALYEEINEEIQENIVIIPLYFVPSFCAYAKNLNYEETTGNLEYYNCSWN